jgi:hypothetical protein
MQKIINVLAVTSFAVSGAVVGSGLYVYLNRASIIDGIKSQVMEAVLGGTGLGAGLGGAVGGELPLGTNDLAPSTPQASISPDATSAPIQF